MTSTKAYSWRYSQADFKFCPRCGGPLVLQDVADSGPRQLVCHACQFIFYLPPQLVVMAVVTYEDCVLLLKRAQPPGQEQWALLAGFVGRHEDPVKALQREAREETGLEITVGDVLKVNAFPEAGMVQLIFAATTCNTHLFLNDECLDADFFTADSIPWENLAFASTRQTLIEFLGVDAP